MFVNWSSSTDGATPEQNLKNQAVGVKLDAASNTEKPRRKSKCATGLLGPFAGKMKRRIKDAAHLPQALTAGAATPRQSRICSFQRLFQSKVTALHPGGG